MNIPNATQIRHRFGRLANVQPSFLHAEIGGRLLDRLELVKLAPSRIVDVGCGSGDRMRQLAQKSTPASVFGFDVAPEMAARATPKKSRWLRKFRSAKLASSAADAHALPLAKNTVDLLFANLMLHWSNDPQALLQEFYRVLNSEKLMVFSCYGPDTLAELKAYDIETPQFIDMHDLGDMALAAGFSDPVMEMEKLVLNYSDSRTLCGDIEIAGLLARDQIATLERRLGEQSLQEFNVTIEVVYGHAWKPNTEAATDNFKGIKIKPV